MTSGDMDNLSDKLGITLEKARSLINDDDAGHALWSMASAVILSEADNNPDLFIDLLQCLKRDGPCGGTAVLGLYTRSGRPWPDSILDNCHDPKEWREYLINAGLLKEEAK